MSRRVLAARATALLVAGAMAALSACARGADAGMPAGGAEPSGPAVPSDLVPELATEERIVTAPLLVEDAPGDEGLAAALAQLEAGSERTFAARTGPLRGIVARILVFSSAAAADAYVAWLRTHPEPFLGDATAAGSVAIPGEPPLLAHERSGCCAKELPSYLVTWARGRLVASLLVSGPEDGAAVTPIAVRLDRVLADWRGANGAS